MTYYEILDAFEDADEQEKLELELEILGKLLYYEND
jgi:hypothetical protein